MDDLISRQTAIDAECEVCQIAPKRERGHNCNYYVHGCKEIECIRALPSAQQWTPCSERFPKKGRYLVTGKKSRDWYESDKIVTSAFYDGEFWTDNGDIQAEAWMPLPEPYKGEKS